jgi:hypothetical protein
VRVGGQAKPGVASAPKLNPGRLRRCCRTAISTLDSSRTLRAQTDQMRLVVGPNHLLRPRPVLACVRRVSSSPAQFDAAPAAMAATFRLPPRTSVYRYGSFAAGRALFKDIGWTMDQRERWAIVGSGKSRKDLIEVSRPDSRRRPRLRGPRLCDPDHMLTRADSHSYQVVQGHHRLDPPVPPPGRHPFLTSLPPSTVPAIRHLLFAQPPASGEFQNYTARYGALHEDDTLTLLEKLLFIADPGDPLTGGKRGAVEARAVARKVGIAHLLDLPVVCLSNGQTRRARMAMALLHSPRLLIVEEPFAGLDPEGRAEMAAILGNLNDEGVRVLLVLRGGEDVPAWVTHVAEATEGGGLRVGKRGAEKGWWRERRGAVAADEATATSLNDGAAGKEVVRMHEVDVSYGPKKVCPRLPDPFSLRLPLTYFWSAVRSSTTSPGASRRVIGGICRATTVRSSVAALLMTFRGTC